jgi:PAB-dependent poly(A)-specific ribonuclease subunit 2
MIVEVGAPPPEIDPQYLATMKATEWGGYGRNRRNRKRNQVDNTRSAEKAPASLQAPKFLSEKARESANDSSNEKKITEVADAIGAIEMPSMETDVPIMYRNVEIKYSKFGVDDFDFA